MTSNMGADIIRDSYDNIDLNNLEEVQASTKLKVFDLLKKSIRPEFLNRIDETVMFEPLNRDNILEIAKIQFEILKKRTLEAGYELSISHEALEFIAELGYDPQFGARPLKRVIQKRIMDELSKQILAGNVESGKVHITMENQMLKFTKAMQPESETL